MGVMWRTGRVGSIPSQYSSSAIHVALSISHSPQCPKTVCVLNVYLSILEWIGGRLSAFDISLSGLNSVHSRQRRIVSTTLYPGCIFKR
jgi:hypothetical protein